MSLQVVYDGACPMCLATVTLIRMQASATPLTFRADRRAGIQLVDDDGVMHTGADARRRILATLEDGNGKRVLMLLWRAPQEVCEACAR